MNAAFNKIRLHLAVLSVCLILFNGTVPSRALAQFREEALTPEEEVAGFAFGATLTKRLRETRDVAPLISELFVSNFEDHLADQLTSRTGGNIVNVKGFYLFFIDPELIPLLKPGELQDYFVQTANFWYLAMLHSLSTLPSSLLNSGRTRFDEILFPEVVTLFRQDPSLAALLEKGQAAIVSDVSLAASGKIVIKDADQFRRATSTLRRAAEEMRGRVTNAEQTEQYRELSQQFDLGSQNNKGQISLLARATLCGNPCGRLPSGTRFIEVISMPYLHLHLAPVNAQLRIFAADLPTD